MDWQTIDRKRKPFIRMGERLFKGMFDKIRRSLIHEIIQAGQVEGVIDSFKIEGDFFEAYERFYLRTATHFAKDMINQYKSGKGPTEVKEFGIDEVLIADILEYVRVHSGKKITQVIRTHYHDIERIAVAAVKTGLDQGLGFGEVAKLIAKEQGLIDTWKALRIARTESVAASNYGSILGAEQLPGTKRKVWISSFTTTSREDHMAMDGKEVGVNEEFMLPDGTQLSYPGDPAGPADQIINCRCGSTVIITDEIF
jgi:hypothetical protein